ncbi:hypothetical protein [Campylobacter helveticus]|uniref:hypothetical protein n=1 Tax=Campylobacter helveticus TaxID=28898 RepID=UPI0022EA490D|nr:hypothetical protein [Campylobacter helveticus]
MQSLLSNFKPKQAEILLSAIKNANDEEFSSFVLNNINAIKAWLHSEEFEKKHLKKPFPPLLNPKFLELDSSRYCANLAWNLNLPLDVSGGGDALSSSISRLTAVVQQLLSIIFSFAMSFVRPLGICHLIQKNAIYDILHI